MNFSERAEARKKSKDLKNEIKQLKKDLIAGGCEKTAAAACTKEFKDALERGLSLREEYEQAGEHLKKAREAIERLLEYMAESPAKEVRESLNELLDDLALVYHDCSIRQDDLDFQSTTESLRQLVSLEMEKGYSPDASGMQAIMLRSELENIKAVLDDASVWRAPDFFSLAYYVLHEDKDRLREMENEQRNTYVMSYAKEHFLDEFLDTCKRAGAEQRARELMQDFVYSE